AKNRSQEIDQIRNALQDEVGRLQVKKDQLESCENELRDKIERSGELLLSIEKEMARIELKKNMIMEYLEELRNYVENRAERLLKLGLLTELQYNDLRGAMRTPRDERALWPGLDDFQNRYVDAISYIQRYLYDKGIIYPRALLETFLTILRTGDLIILSGLSGAGKTQLVKAFSEATGNVAHIIPVKPNWTSSEDLLGYYNPMQRAYMTTPFLDALIAAKRDPDRLHIICLDEMNLARVEYYFADFLSALEERVKVPTIALYSEEEAGHVQSELQLFVDLLLELGEGRELNSFGDFLLDEQVMRALKERLGVTEAESFIQLHARLRRMLAGVLNVPAVLEIPENVRFVGAVNVDETTHYFSPKVLDRAHVLQFQSP
ncbi:MAG: restriction endonuclease, partial [Methanobacteriota archaeon]